MATTEREFQIAPIVPESVMHNTKVTNASLPRRLVPPTTSHAGARGHETLLPPRCPSVSDCHLPHA